MNTFKKSRNFVYRNARPLDFARFRYHFENGTKEEILKILAAYQNPDGGFGHALENDSWNPNSTPIQTWAATEILKEIDYFASQNSIIEGILRYLGSGVDFEGEAWLNTVKTNDDYPHAPWWSFADNSPINPSASLAGFILLTADRESDIFKTAERVAKNCFAEYMKNPCGEMHELRCMTELFEYCNKAGIVYLFDLEILKNKLCSDVKNCICQNTDEWDTNYVCKPSRFISSRNSIFYEDSKETAEYECDFIKKTQLESGAWSITWSWGAYDNEFAISANWWRSHFVIENLLYLKNFGKL